MSPTAPALSKPIIQPKVSPQVAFESLLSRAWQIREKQKLDKMFNGNR